MTIHFPGWGRNALPRIKHAFKKPDEFRSVDAAAHDRQMKAGKPSPGSTPKGSGASSPARSDSSSSLSSLGKSISPPQLLHASSFTLHETPDAFFHQARKAPKPRTEGIRKEDIAIQWDSGVTYKGGRHTKPNELTLNSGRKVDRQPGGSADGAPRLRTTIPSGEFGEVFDAGGAWRLSLPSEKKTVRPPVSPKSESAGPRPETGPEASPEKKKTVRFAD